MRGPSSERLQEFDQIVLMYVSPIAASVLPLDPSLFMQLIGVIEMLVGLTILSSWTRLGAYIAAGWLTLIASNLLLTGVFLDLAVRDLVMALADFTLSRLTEWREEATALSGWL